MYLETFLIAPLFVYLASADQQGCRKVQINNPKLYGECCVYVRERDINVREQIHDLLLDATEKKPFVNGKKHPPEQHPPHSHGHGPAPLESHGSLIPPRREVNGNDKSPFSSNGIRNSSELHKEHGNNLTQSIIKQPNANNISHKATELEDNSGDFMFPTERTTSTTTPIVMESNTTTADANITGKFIVDNRNAVDAPQVNCPEGQGRLPNGQCGDEF